VFQAYRLVHRSTFGWRVTKMKTEETVPRNDARIKSLRVLNAIPPTKAVNVCGIRIKVLLVLQVSRKTVQRRLTHIFSPSSRGTAGFITCLPRECVRSSPKSSMMQGTGA